MLIHRIFVFFLVLLRCPIFFFFFFNDTATTEIYTLSLHDALPIWRHRALGQQARRADAAEPGDTRARERRGTFVAVTNEDRKSTRLNSSHLVISYAVFCLKKKKKIEIIYVRDAYYSKTHLLIIVCT